MPAASSVRMRPATCNGSIRATHSPTINGPEVPSRASPELGISGQYSDFTSGLSFLRRAWKRLSTSHNSQLENGTLEVSDDEQLLVSAGDKPFQRRSQTVHIPPLPECLDLYV